MIDTLINPADTPERQAQKLLQIAHVLMRRVEQITDDSGAAHAQFQRWSCATRASGCICLTCAIT